jgi:outer membrane lipoprotein-sorting protein
MKHSLPITLTLLAAITYAGTACQGPTVTPTDTDTAPAGPATNAPVVEQIGTIVPTGEYILKQVDRNMTATSTITTAKMIIHDRRRPRTVRSKSWAKGEEASFTEYLSPAREKGTKMLKLKDRLWVYSPHTDRTIQLSGHMLRQSVMGSDLSYEDMMDDPRLTELYTAEVTGTDTVDARVCWVLQLTAKTNDVAYQARKVWIDRQRYVPMREELYAKGGKLLKRIDLKDFKQDKGRWYPMRMIFKDMLKTGEGTEFVIESIEFDARIPEHRLTKAALRR